MFGRTYAGTPDVLVEELAEDSAIAAADTVMPAIPSQLGVEYCTHVVESLLVDVAPALGWRRDLDRSPIPRHPWLPAPAYLRPQMVRHWG